MLKKIDETHLSNNRTVEIYSFLHEGKIYAIYIFDNEGIQFDMVLSLQNMLDYITNPYHLINNKDVYDITEYFAGEEPNWDALKNYLITLIKNNNG